MTYEKASELLAMIEVKEPNELIVNSWWGSFVEDYKDALQTAIKSLEAWNTIREIFKAKATSEDWEYIHDLQIWEDALDIIDKHLSEVSE